MDQVSYIATLPLGGFNYDNCIRNKALLANSKAKGGAGQLKTAKTGTTICGIIFAVSNLSFLHVCRAKILSMRYKRAL